MHIEFVSVKEKSRTWLDKKSGRKHPRPNDIDDIEITATQILNTAICLAPKNHV